LPGSAGCVDGGRYDARMSLMRYLILPIGIILVGIAYWLLSYEMAGTVMLLVFGIAMGFVGWILVPTFDDVGPTAPIDHDWHERRD
jgi:hypothetical protein